MAGGYGELKTLHMKDLRWNNPHTKALLDRLGPVPQACGLTRVLSGVKKSDYADLIPGKRAERALQPYYFAFNGLASVLGRWIPDSDQMTFVFEEQRRYSVASTLRAGDIALEARNSQGVPKIKGVSFVPKASTSRLEQADFFAYPLLRLYRDRRSTKTAWCRSILGDMKGIGTVLSRKEVRSIVEEGNRRVFPNAGRRD